MDLIGRGSAATLGYITGGTKGAVFADQLYKAYKGGFKLRKFTKNNSMAPTGRRGSTSSNMSGVSTATSASKKRRLSLAGTPSGRRASISSIASSSSVRTARLRRSLFNNVAGNNGSDIRVKAIKQKGRKVHKEGRKKVVKVPKLLRKQVKQILHPKDPVGTFMEIHSERKVLKDTGQSLKQIGHLSNSTNGILFDPCYILYATSVLFNNKIGQTNPTFTSTSLIAPKTLKINVLKQHTTYRMKNNTARVMNIKLYLASPKHIIGPDEGGDPSFYWIDSMKNEEPPAGTFSSDARNLAAATPNTLYATPYMSKMFLARYAVDQTSIILEPGKEYHHTVQGPSRVYDYAKFYQAESGIQNQKIQNNQKFVKYAFITCYYDLAGTTSGNCSRGINMYSASDTNSFGLLVETTNYMKIACPERVGFVADGAFVSGTKQELNFRKENPYYLRDFSNLGPVGAISLINDNIPNAPASAGV